MSEQIREQLLDEAQAVMELVPAIQVDMEMQNMQLEQMKNDVDGLMVEVDEVVKFCAEQSHELLMKKRENAWISKKLMEKKEELDKTANKMAINDMKWRISETENKELKEKIKKLQEEKLALLDKSNKSEEKALSNGELIYESDTFSA